MIDSKPIGIIGDDDRILAFATAFAAAGQRTLIYFPHTNVSPVRTRNVERAATPADIAIECSIVLLSIVDGGALRDLIVGTRDRAGIGVDLAPGAILIDCAVRPPRELQVLSGILGTRGIAMVDAAVALPRNAETKGSNPEILIGGFPDATVEAAAVLSMLGSVTPTGPLGSAHLLAASLAILWSRLAVVEAEVLAFAQQIGLPPALSDRFCSWQTDQWDQIELQKRLIAAGRIAASRDLPPETIALMTEPSASAAITTHGI